MYSQLYAILTYKYHNVFNEGLKIIRNSKETVFPSHSNLHLQIKELWLRININKTVKSLKWKKLPYFQKNSMQFLFFSQVKRDVKQHMLKREKRKLLKMSKRGVSTIESLFFPPLTFLLKEGIWNWPINSFSFRKVALYKEKASVGYPTTDSFLANAIA